MLRSVSDLDGFKLVRCNQQQHGRSGSRLEPVYVIGTLGGEELNTKEFKREIKAYQARKDYSQEDLAIKMHMSVYQLRRRLLHPEKFTLDELVRLEKVLGMKILA